MFNEVLKHAKSVLKDGDIINIVQTNNGKRIVSYEAKNIEQLYRFLELDYVMFLGTGGSDAAISAQVQRVGDKLFITYRYILLDTYDWSISSPFLPLFPTDEDVGELHKAGYAKSYIIKGELTRRYEVQI